MITVNTAATNVLQGDLIYLKAGKYSGTYKVISVAGNTLTLDTPFLIGTGTTGFVNINRLRPYYKLLTEITYINKITNQAERIISTNRPDLTGLINADLSSFLQSLLQAKDESTYTQTNFRDNNLSASYTIRYAEHWDDGTTEGHTSSYVAIEHSYYVTYSAKQLGDAYGGNLAAYVPFKTVLSAGQRAKWITDFAEPVYSNGFPFDIGFIYSEHLAGLTIYAELTLLNINRQPIPGGTLTSELLNEDGSFLLDTDGTRFIIARPDVSDNTIAEHIGLNRLLVNGPFADDVWYFDLALKYDDGGTERTVTQIQTIRIDKTGDDRSIYLRWIGLTGSWNYYRFSYNQEVTLDVQNAVIIKNYIFDWANQDAIEDVISKSAGQKIKVMAEDLSVADIKGLQSIKYSPKVQMLVSNNPVKWQTVIINTATYSEYETINGQAPFSITFNLPAINVQRQ